MSLSKLKKKADVLLRENLINNSYKFRGRIQCYITGKWFYPEDLQVCHYIRRSVPRFRYDKDNCKLCCEYTNMFEDQIPTDYKSASGKSLSLHEYKFRNRLIEEYGIEKVEAMETYSGSFKLKRTTIEDIIEKLNESEI